jgi:hypothetical protein
LLVNLQLPATLLLHVLQWESQSSCIYPASQHGTPRSSSSNKPEQQQQQQNTSSSISSRSPLGAINEDPAGTPAAAAADAGEPPDVREWSNVLAVFDDLLLQLHNNWVPQQVVAAMFVQLFVFVNVQLFNQVMLRRECCSLANAEFVAAGLDQVSCTRALVWVLGNMSCVITVMICWLLIFWLNGSCRVCGSRP